MIFKSVLVAVALCSTTAFQAPAMKVRLASSKLSMSDPPELEAARRREIAGGQKGNVVDNNPYASKPSMGIKKQDDRKGTKFNYDPSNFRDSANDGNYRRLSDALSAAKAEDEKMAREKEELMRKEAMERMFLEKENATFWGTPGSQVVAKSEEMFIPPQVLQIISELDNQLIGLKPVKEKMRRYAAQMLVHKIRKEAGIKSEIGPLHHVFTGNPGTGKTTVAMKMGELYREMGFINVGHTVQATRADLVGQYIGHTGPKTKEMITRSFGGILFIDEAYGLYKEDSRDYGSEVIEMLVKFMDNVPNTDFVVVLAGYRNLMTKMLNANLNLMARMGNWIDFPDYDDAELLEISQLLAKNYQYSYPDGAKKKFSEFMNLRKEFPYFSNARTVRNAMERARRVAATRVLGDALDNGTKYTMDEIQSFKESDFQLMVDEIKNLDRATMLP
jgi:probable Rubsico expression protein CbbX